MTTLGMEQETFKRFQEFREKILNAQSVAEISQIKSEMQPYIDKDVEHGGFKLDTRKVLENAIAIREAELYGEPAPTLTMNTQTLSKEMLPKKPPVGEEVDLSKVEPTPLTGRAKEISEEMASDDAKNFTPVPPTTQDTSTTEKKTRARKEKPTEELTVLEVPRAEKSIKIFRRINVSINGISYTNNEAGYEVVASTREEAEAESTALREVILADIKGLNDIMKVKPASQQVAPTPTPTAPAQPTTPTATVSPVEKPSNPNIQQDATEVFGGENVTDALAKKDPSSLASVGAKNHYNLERLRVLFAELRAEDGLTVKLPDGTEQLLGEYITERTKKFSLSFPIAKP